MALGDLGMNVVGTGDTDPTDTTTIRYPTSLAAQANTVAAAVPGAKLVPDATVQNVTLTLGSDGLTPSNQTAAATADVPATATGAPAVDDANGGLACTN